MPPVSLFDEVTEWKWGLFFNVSPDPFDWVPSHVVEEGYTPVFAYASLESNVEAHGALNFRVDHPVRSFDPRKCLVQLVESPSELELVIWYTDSVHKSKELTVRRFLLGLVYKAICKWMFLSFVFDQLIFVVTPLCYFESIFYIEVTLLVHMHDPRIFMSFVVHWSVMQRSGFEESVQWRMLIIRTHYLSHVVSLSSEVQLIVSQYLNFPGCPVIKYFIIEGCLHVKHWLRNLLKISSFRYEPHMNYRFFIFIRVLIWFQTLFWFKSKIPSNKYNESY